MPEGLDVALREATPQGHKIATRNIARGEPVIRYGQMIGEATADIPAGSHVHVHNLGMGAHDQNYVYGVEINPPAAPATAREFMGYHRSDGKVGTRNYIGVLTTVNCSGSVARFIAEAAERGDWLGDLKNVDGVVPIVHGTGCGMSGRDEGYETLFRTLKGYARNPNFGGILLVGLGCEVMQIPDLIGAGRMRADGNFRYMTIQQTGGTRRTVEKGVEMLREMALKANEVARAARPGLGAGGRPAVRRFGRLLRHHRESRRSASPRTCSSRTAARRSCPRRRRSTAPSIC